MHPVLNTPWYLLHPCQTGKMLDALVEERVGISDETRFRNQLIAWLRIYFQPFGIDLIQNPKPQGQVQDSSIE